MGVGGLKHWQEEDFWPAALWLPERGGGGGGLSVYFFVSVSMCVLYTYIYMYEALHTTPPPPPEKNIKNIILKELHQGP